MEAAVRLEGVSFSFPGQLVLKDISMTISKGDFLGIIGPNGSGKTTLLKIMLGIYTPTKGKVYLFGKEFSKFNQWDKIGYVPQKATNIEKNFPATVHEVVSMGLLAKKKLPKIFFEKDLVKIKNALSIVQMQKYSEKRITELSGGQQQRVLIAKALVNDPEVLMLDEPTTGVDQSNQISFYDLLGKLNKKGITILLVSHDTGYITKYVTKVASINQKLEFYGTHVDFCANDDSHDHNHSLCLKKD